MWWLWTIILALVTCLAFAGFHGWAHEERRRKEVEAELDKVRRELLATHEQVARAESPVTELPTAFIEDVVLN